MIEVYYDVVVKISNLKNPITTRYNEKDFDKANEFYQTNVDQMEELEKQYGNPEFDFSIEMIRVEVVSTGVVMNKREWFSDNK